MKNYIKLVENVLSEYELEFELCDSIDNTICIYDLNEKGQTYSFFLTISEKGTATLMCLMGEYDDKCEKLSIYEKLNDINNRYSFIKVFIDSDGNIVATYEFVLTNDTEALRNILLANIIAYSQVTSIICFD